MRSNLDKKPQLLFLILGGFFIMNAILAEFLGVKIFSLEKTLGMTPVDWTLFAQDGLSFNMTAGVLIWPVVFVMTDVINEYYGRRGVKILSYLTALLITYAFMISVLAIYVVPADFWITSHLNGLPERQAEHLVKEVGNYNTAYALVFGQGMWIIVGSIIAFLVGQILDVAVFQQIKKWTGENYLWLRSTGSTVVSQFVDSFVVLFVAFYIGASWSMEQVIAIGIVNYVYKFFIAIILTPLIYLVHYVIDAYLGNELSQKMRKEALLT